MGLSVLTIRNIENGTNPPPNETRLKIWLSELGESSRLAEATALLRSYKRFRKLTFQPRHEANEHLNRLLDAYESGKLDELDMRLLQMIAPRGY